MFRFAVRAIGVLAASLVLIFHAATAEEGMWTFDHFPADQVERAYGVKIDRAWLDRVQASSVRFTNNCSASIVSGNGLVFSAHHCVASCVQGLSTANNDYMRDGFAAAGREDERKCPGIQAEIVLSISDVTGAVKNAAAGAARDGVIAGIEDAACGKNPGLRCEVVSYYSGGQFKLYKYRRYSDVRVVFVPEYSMASFGGDPDNFNFPRYGMDVSFVRLYDDGKPVKTPQHLNWVTRTPKAGELTFLSGYPAATNRMLTVSQMETQRDVRLPVVTREFSELRGRMIRFAEESPEHRRVSADPLANVEGYYKYVVGGTLALNDKTLLDAKRAEEMRLKVKVFADPKLAAEIGDPWSDIDKIQAAYAQNYFRFRMLEVGSQSTLFQYARLLVRAALDRDKPAASRLPEFSDTRLTQVREQLLDPSPIDPALDQLYLEFWLSKTREYLSPDDLAVKGLLGQESPEGLAARLIKNSRLADVAARQVLWDGGLPAIRASHDPLIQLVLRLEPFARAARKVWESDVTGPTDAAAGRIAAARFAILGDAVYPNGSRTLRLAYGKIDGWSWRGATVAPFTNFAGLYARVTGSEPFQLAPHWIASEHQLNPSTVLDFAFADDGAPGNSGSPVFNAQAEILGVEFDGNIHAVGGDYGYDGRVNRLIGVSTAAVTEALVKIYNRQDLVHELAAR